MKNALLIPVLFIFLFAGFVRTYAADRPPVVGLCIAAPQSDAVDQFITFMEEELGPGEINTLVLRVDYNFAYDSHPELRNENPLSKKQVKSLVRAARSRGIRINPKINLRDHQSWQSKLEKLLEVCPQFDETPSVRLPESYEWPNQEGLYCKSYCPLHPEVHSVAFSLVDEIMEGFEADAFHGFPDVTCTQLEMTDSFRANTPEQQRDRYYGFMQTFRSPAEGFLVEYQSTDQSVSQSGQAGSLKAIMKHHSKSR